MKTTINIINNGDKKVVYDLFNKNIAENKSINEVEN